MDDSHHSPRRRRLGIGGKLLAAFGAIAALTVAATIVAWILFANVRENLVIIAEEALPEIAASFSIAEEIAQLSAAVPQLIAATGASDLAAIRASLNERLDTVTDLSHAHAGHAQDTVELVERLDRNVHGLRDHIERLGLAVERRLAARQKREFLLDALSSDHIVFTDTVDPIIESVRAEIVAATRRAVANATKESQAVVRDTEAGIQQFEDLLFIHSETSELFGLLGEAGNAIYSEDIEAIRTRFDLLRKRISKQLDAYEAGEHDAAVRRTVEEILSYGEGERSVLTGRLEQLEADESAAEILAESQRLAARLSMSAQGLVDEAEEAGASAEMRTMAALSTGEFVLVALAALSLAAALLIAWLYVYRRIVRRMTSLSGSMLAIAGGDLDAEIVSRAGDDEIADMGGALEVFREDAFKRRQAEQAVRASEQRMRLILATSPIGVGISRIEDGTLVYANARLAQQFGQSADELVGSRAVDLYAEPGERDRILARVDREGSVTDAEVLLKRADGSDFWSLLSFFPIEYSGESARLGWIYDIAERKRAEVELREAKERAEKALGDLRAAQARLVQTEKMASLGQLTAGVAHEIKNPLNFVKNFAEVSAELLEELKEGLHSTIDSLAKDQREDALDQFATIEDMLAKIREHGNRADRIVQSMLSHTREAPADTEPTDLNALVEECVDLAYHAARAEDQRFNVTLERTFDPDVGELDLYPADLRRVFLNLLGNAFYATRKRADEGGGADYAPTVSISTRRGDDAVEIRVRDNGTGIPESVREKVFDPFFTTKPPGEGTGLGLSLSYETVVQQHGGWMEASSREGEFTEFLVTLPR